MCRSESWRLLWHGVLPCGWLQGKEQGWHLALTRALGWAASLPPDSATTSWASPTSSIVTSETREGGSGFSSQLTELKSLPLSEPVTTEPFSLGHRSPLTQSLLVLFFLFKGTYMLLFLPCTSMSAFVVCSLFLERLSRGRCLAF